VHSANSEQKRIVWFKLKLNNANYSRLQSSVLRALKCFSFSEISSPRPPIPGLCPWTHWGRDHSVHRLPQNPQNVWLYATASSTSQETAFPRDHQRSTVCLITSYSIWSHDYVCRLVWSFCSCLSCFYVFFHVFMCFTGSLCGCVFFSDILSIYSAV